jgi:ethanolamine ammonia-lyase large subunit
LALTELSSLIAKQDSIVSFVDDELLPKVEHLSLQRIKDLSGEAKDWLVQNETKVKKLAKKSPGLAKDTMEDIKVTKL